MKNSRVFKAVAAVLLTAFLSLPAAADSNQTPQAALPMMPQGHTVQAVPERGEKLPPEVPLNQPNIEPTALVPLAGVLVTEALSLERDTYEDSLRKVSRNFTKDGWASFTKSLQKTKIISSLLTEGEFVTQTPGTAFIVKEGEVDGRYRWTLSVPLTVEFNGPISQVEKHIVSITVMRVPQKENVLGLMIDNWIIND